MKLLLSKKTDWVSDFDYSEIEKRLYVFYERSRELKRSGFSEPLRFWENEEGLCALLRNGTVLKRRTPYSRKGAIWTVVQATPEVKAIWVKWRLGIPTWTE